MRPATLLRLFLSICVLALAVGWSFLGMTTASADVTLGVAPSLIEVTANSGGEASQELTIYNDGSEPFGVLASVEPYKGGKGDQSAVDWLKVEPGSFELAAGSQRHAKVSITVPDGARVGGRYAMVAFKTVASGSTGSGAGVAGQIGIPFLISVGSQDTLTRQARLQKLVPVLQADGRVGFRALLANRGNLHVVAQGEVEVRQADGPSAEALAGRLDFPQTTAILPQSEETLASDGTLPLQEGVTYRARARIEYGGGGPAVAETAFKARAALKAENLSASESPVKGPTLRLDLRNEGELGITPRVQFAVRNAEGRLLGTAELPRPPLVMPGQTAKLETTFPQRLSSGEYALVALVEYGAATPIRLETSFRLGGPLPTPNPVWGEAPERARDTGQSFPWWLAVAVVLAIAGGSLGWLPALAPVRRRFQRALQALREAD